MIQRLWHVVIPAFAALAACQPAGDAAGEPVAAAPAPPAAPGPPAFRPTEPPAGEQPAPTPVAAAAVQTHHLETRVARSADGALELTAEVVPAAGYHINTEENFPWRLTIAPDAPIAAGTMLTRGDATLLDDSKATFVVRAPDPGSAVEVAGTFRFGVCNDDGCVNVNTPVAWSVSAL